MSNLRKAAEMVLEAWGWDWSEPRNEALKERMEALRQALAQPEQGNNSPNYPNTEPNTSFVDAVNMRQERVDETAKCVHDALIQGRGFMLDGKRIDPTDFYKQEPKREWVGLTKEDMPVGDNPMFDTDEFAFGAAWAQAKLKEKNT